MSNYSSDQRGSYDSFDYAESSQSGRCNESDSPPTPVPVSLESLIKYKATPRKNAKQIKAFEAPIESTNDNSKTLALARNDFTKSRIGSTSHAPLDHANGKALDMMFDFPANARVADGCFRHALHSNGDLSIFQWSGTNLVWDYIGRLANNQIQTFVAFTTEALEGDKYRKPNGALDQRRAQNEVVNMARELSLVAGKNPDQSKDLNGRPQSPLSSKIAKYRQHFAGLAKPSLQTSHPNDFNESDHAKQGSKSTEPQGRAAIEAAERQAALIASRKAREISEDPFSVHSDIIRPYSSTNSTSVNGGHQDETHKFKGSSHGSTRAAVEKRDPRIAQLNAAISGHLKSDNNKTSEPAMSPSNTSMDQSLRRTVLYDPYKAGDNPNDKAKKYDEADHSTSLNGLSGGDQSSRYKPIPQRHRLLGGRDTSSQPSLSAETLVQSSASEPFSLDGHSNETDPASMKKYTDDELRAMNERNFIEPGHSRSDCSATGIQTFLCSDQNHHDRDANYVENLVAFWNSGKKDIMKQDDFVKRTLTAAGQSNDHTAYTSTFLMTALHDSLEKHVQSSLALPDHVQGKDLCTDYWTQHFMPRSNQVNKPDPKSISPKQVHKIGDKGMCPFPKIARNPKNGAQDSDFYATSAKKTSTNMHKSWSAEKSGSRFH